MKRAISILALLLFLLSFLNAGGTKLKGLYAKDREVKRFISYMIKKHHFKRSYLIKLFSYARVPRPFRYKKIRRRLHYGYIKNRWLKRVGYTRHEKAYLTRDRVIPRVKFVKRYRTLLSRIRKNYNL